MNNYQSFNTDLSIGFYLSVLSGNLQRQSKAVCVKIIVQCYECSVNSRFDQIVGIILRSKWHQMKNLL